MERATIEITSCGLMLYGHQIGKEPRMRDILDSIPYDPSRSFAMFDNTRLLTVFDPAGIWVLSERSPDWVLAVNIAFQTPKWRPLDEKDPKELFCSPMRIGTAVFAPPITRKVAELMSEKTFPDLSFFFTTQSKEEVAAITISFPLNEAKIAK